MYRGEIPDAALDRWYARDYYGVGTDYFDPPEPEEEEEEEDEWDRV